MPGIAEDPGTSRAYPRSCEGRELLDAFTFGEKNYEIQWYVACWVRTCVPGISMSMHPVILYQGPDADLFVFLTIIDICARLGSEE